MIIMKSLIIKLLIPLSALVIIFSAAGCKKEVVLSLNTTEITLKRNETFNLVVSPDASGCTFRSGNDNIAEVYSSGLVEAKLVGETTITVTNTDKGYYAFCKVTVTPEYTIYREPYLVFGRSKSDIKTYEKRQIADETDSTILYTGENSSLDSILYSFENSAYTSSTCTVPSSQSSLLLSYLVERYVYIGTLPNGLVARLTTDGTTYVVTQFYSPVKIYVYYFPKSTSKKGTGLVSDSELSKTVNDINNKVKGFYRMK
jgi:hypothetical protein